MSATGSGHRGLWAEPKYPGDAVRQLMLYRGAGRTARDTEMGFIAIQHYQTFVKVGSFLPGVEEGSPGDTPKTWPEKNTTFLSNETDHADAVFDGYAQEAYAAGWQNYHAEQH